MTDPASEATPYAEFIDDLGRVNDHLNLQLARELRARRASVIISPEGIDQVMISCGLEAASAVHRALERFNQATGREFGR